MKGQTEIIGLAFVVIIGIFGLIIYVAVSSSVESTNTLREEQLALSMLTTMVQVDVGNVKYSDLVVSCITRNIEDDCEKLERTTDAMLGSLEELNQPYMFAIENEEGIVEFPTSGIPLYFECDEDSDRPAANEQPIPLYGTSSHVNMILAFCS